MFVRRRRDRSVSGLSLLELVSTMATFTVLAALALPRYDGMRGPYTLRQASHQIAAEFQKARMRAIARNARHRFTYDSTTRVYSLQRETGPNAWVTEGSSQLPTGVTVTTLATPPIFDTRGLLNAPLTITVNVQGHPVTRTVAINVLGHVTVT
jgi:Tfp pilus assembly protein FimT